MEDSSNDRKPRCQCGFWGSPQTSGLCSVCYRKACRNQSQGSSLTSDAGKSGIGSCHSQTQASSGQGIKMDSRHFPSRSTTDNLPSSLSSPPGERAALSAAAPATMSDASTSTATSASCSSGTSGGPSSSHLPNLVSSEGKGCTDTLVVPAVMAASSHVTMTKVGESLTPSPSDTDTCSSASSDLSYDPKRDNGVLTPSVSSDSCSSSLVSVVSSAVSCAASSVSTASVPGDNMTVTSQSPAPVLSSPQNGAQLKTMPAADSNASTTQPSTPNAVTLSRQSAASTKAQSISSPGALGSSSKGTATHVDRAEKKVSSVSTGEEPGVRTEDVVPPAPSIASPAERGVKRSRDEMEASSVKSPPPASPQKNKKRCFVCSCKLELAQRTIGRCRCGRVFCGLHRLPELHDCEFNHKEDGRREAREKMVKPTRHLGPSYRREDNS